jgi:phosphohistidine phosphatase
MFSPFHWPKMRRFRIRVQFEPASKSTTHEASATSMNQPPPYPAWIYRQSGLLPFRWRGEKLEVLLISSRGGKRWVLPKGIVEPGMSPAASALKEAIEEAGIDGSPGETPLGRYRYDKWGGTCEVEVYPMRVDNERDTWPESKIRRRRWQSVRKAMRRVKNKGLRQLIKNLPATVNGAAATAADKGAPMTPGRLVYLFRHAKSSWEDQTLNDFDRPLAPRGTLACDAMRRYMAIGDIHPDRVVCSAAVRTRQTLEGVLPAIGEQAILQHFRGLYLAGPQAMLNRLRRTDEAANSVMLVAHNPGTQSLALRLASSGNATDLARLGEKFPTGALATLIFRGNTWSDLGPGTCELHSFVCPRDIGADAKR